MSEEEETAADRSPRGARKDRLVQTRVPRDLEQTLKQEAQRQRLSVSHLIRNVLEDAFVLVDGVVANVDQIVSDSVDLARHVGRGMTRDERRPSDHDAKRADKGPADDLSHVYAWNEVVLHRAARCSRCRAEIARGERGFAGLSDTPRAPRAWLCASCIGEL